MSALLEAVSRFARGLGWFTVDDGLRGLGGCCFEVDAEGRSNDLESLDGLLKATGFLGGAGAGFVLAFDATDARCLSFSALVYVLNRFNAEDSSMSSSEDRSIKFGEVVCGEGFLSGSFGLASE